jgi:hypothetical protein
MPGVVDWDNRGKSARKLMGLTKSDLHSARYLRWWMFMAHLTRPGEPWHFLGSVGETGHKQRCDARYLGGPTEATAFPSCNGLETNSILMKRHDPIRDKTSVQAHNA